VVSKSKESGVYVHRLHALDIVTGNEKPSSPVVVQGSVPGGGIGSVNGVIAFQPEWELNRTGLLLYSGHVYVAHTANDAVDVIERCVHLWSNPGELVLSPFAGIGSEGFESVRLGRRFIGFELKPSYANVAAKNLATAESMKLQGSLFAVV
jgi:DNA modification methylase